jgi:hypothetical protein
VSCRTEVHRYRRSRGRHAKRSRERPKQGEQGQRTFKFCRTLTVIPRDFSPRRLRSPGENDLYPSPENKKLLRQSCSCSAGCCCWGCLPPFTRSRALPMALAFILMLVLQPAMRFRKRLRLPRGVAASHFSRCSPRWQG